MENAAKEKEINKDAEQSDVERLQEELNRERNMHLRALADFDNYRKRVERERTSAAQVGKRDLILSLLGVVDNFERALEHAPDVPNQVVEGLRVIQNQLLGILQGQGVTPFRSVGEQFNPALHEAIGAVNTDEFEPGTVFDEYQRGYMLNDELLRPARVRVVQ